MVFGCYELNFSDIVFSLGKRKGIGIDVFFRNLRH